MSEGRQGWRYDSIEEWYETIRSVFDARFRALMAGHELFPMSPGLAAVERDLLWLNISWREIEGMSFPFILAVEPERRALEERMDSLSVIVEDVWDRELSDEIVARYRADYLAWKALPVEPLRTLPSEIPFAPRPEQIHAHALALYELIAPKVPPDRRRGMRQRQAGAAPTLGSLRAFPHPPGRVRPNASPKNQLVGRWPDKPQLYNEQAMRIVGEILACYYGAPVTNVKRCLQTARAQARLARAARLRTSAPRKRAAKVRSDVAGIAPRQCRHDETKAFQ